MKKKRRKQMKKEAKIEEKKFGKSHNVSVKSISFLSIKPESKEQVFSNFDNVIGKMERFLRILERKFGQVIWYIGTDIMENQVTERFLFDKSGFMEIILKKHTSLKAFFPQKKHAEKFAKALRKTLKKHSKSLAKSIKQPK